jgi:hypothetical protein
MGLHSAPAGHDPCTILVPVVLQMSPQLVGFEAPLLLNSQYGVAVEPFVALGHSGKCTLFGFGLQGGAQIPKPSTHTCPSTAMRHSGMQKT